MTTSGTAIAFDHVVKNFRFFASPLDRVLEALHPMGKVYHTPLPVLLDVTFTIPKGQAVAVLGPNGVGKSTLLHLVAGVLKPSSGMIAVSGSVFALLDLAGDFAPELTGRENVRFFHDLIAQGSGDRDEMERFVERFAEIGDYFDRPIRTYSSGMLLRLAFAAAIALEPDILLIDEVIAVGDALFQQRCFRRLREIRERGTTILLVTHMAEMILGLCDRVLLFDHGELVFDGDPSTGVAKYYQLFFKAPELPIPEKSRETLRYGEGGAKIVRSFATQDGIKEVLRFERGERVTIVLYVLFERAISAPHFGFSCSTKEGVRIYATATTLLGANPTPSFAGERRRVEISFKQSFAVSDIFVDLSVFEVAGGSISVLDTRLGVLHLTVTSVRYCMGVVDLEAVFAESTLGQGDVDRELLMINATGTATFTEQESRRPVNSTESASGGTEVIL
ncbi:MAG TPA: ABC transporter ATP-binding protein [Pyrinomonadaceae bacterium]|jgi:ABC-type polysaccharide/polyol phosphate transport system ATPase subunit